MKFRFVFWDVLPCKIIVDRRIRGTCCLHHQGALMMEAARTSETSVDNYFTRKYIPEDKSKKDLSFKNKLAKFMVELSNSACDGPVGAGCLMCYSVTAYH
jgi:hypothetical protein